MSSLFPAQAGQPAPSDKSAYDFTFTAIDGAELPLSQFRGKALLVVNTASKCGFTPQYKGLEALYQRYRDRGLVVLGVPSNDFGGQEPGDEREIKSFCEVNYGVTFPLTAKNTVYGDNAHPFYRWAKEVLGAAAVPKWNFHKYLVDRHGTLVQAFGSRTAPDDAALIAAIEASLATP